MQAAHEAIAIGGALGFVAIVAGLASARFGTPLLLVFLLLGMAAGEDGLGGIRFDDVGLTYLIGSVALAVILFEGGQKTSLAMVRAGLWPAILLATVGVAVTAACVGAVVMLVAGVDWQAGLLLGALVAPTDAAAVASVLRASRLALPERLLAVLELESGLNDPMAVFLTVLLTALIAEPGDTGMASGLLLFAREMAGGAVIGLAGGGVVLLALRSMRLDGSLYAVMVLALILALFGAAQLIECSGFLAVYLAGIVVGARGRERAALVERGFETFAWLSQIGLFVLLGLLITPHKAAPLALDAGLIALVLIFVARPLAVALCLLPFRMGWRQTAFVSWVGLRGAVPIYLAMIPVLAGVANSDLAFAAAFVIVVVSLVIQGWTIGPAARLLRVEGSAPATPAH